MTTTINIQGKNYTIPNDKVQHIISILEAYKVAETPQQQVREVLTSNPHFAGRSLING
jgi:hypothetical protein